MSPCYSSVGNRNNIPRPIGGRPTTGTTLPSWREPCPEVLHRCPSIEKLLPRRRIIDDETSSRKSSSYSLFGARYPKPAAASPPKERIVSQPRRQLDLPQDPLHLPRSAAPPVLGRPRKALTESSPHHSSRGHCRPRRFPRPACFLVPLFMQDVTSRLHPLRGVQRKSVFAFWKQFFPDVFSLGVGEKYV